MNRILPLLLLLLIGCYPEIKLDVDPGGLGIDADGDGVVAADDCDDADAEIYPGAPERCNDLDDDCDGEVDEDGDVVSYADADRDGYGDPDAMVRACEVPTGHVSTGDDCDDANSSIFPGAEELCNGVDDDCDGVADPPDREWFADADGDGFGDGLTALESCDQPDGFVPEGGDCDDTDSAVNPGAVEICNGIDDDCDDIVDEELLTVYYRDRDGDGYGDPGTTLSACEQPEGYADNVDDCDDADPAINPEGAEVCGGIDEDCDGLIDDADPDVDTSGGGIFHVDSDLDGYGDPATTIQACGTGGGAVSDATDCDDSDASVNPGASEVCNGSDDDCDGLVDDADDSVDVSTGSSWHADVDGDGYGDAGASSLACSQPAGTVADSTDCDDSSSAVSPAATEICNEIDDDCDGDIDDDDSSLDTSTHRTWYEDGDGDGFGVPTSTTAACAMPSGYADVDTDCDDADAAVNPSASEVCNELDDDCDGDIDDDDSSLDTSTADVWYPDADGDGYGDAETEILACEEPSGVTTDDSDCDDSDPDVNPDGVEVCNGYDDDCDGVADSSALCPCNLEYRSGDTLRPYLFCTSTQNWVNARDACDAEGYALVSIEDGVEDAWVNATADGYSTNTWWIGFNDRASEGSWVWQSGEPVTYDRWRPGQPDNQGNEDCAEINRWHPAQTWNDIGCNRQMRYICEAW